MRRGIARFQVQDARFVKNSARFVLFVSAAFPANVQNSAGRMDRRP